MAYTEEPSVSEPVPVHEGSHSLTERARGWLARSPRLGETLLVWMLGIAVAWVPIILVLRLLGVL
jgi:hypothetical protein